MTAEADQLIAQGRVNEGLQMVGRLAAAGDRDALFKLATWKLEGRLLPRDLPASRELFRRAGEAGHKDAVAVHTAFVANGTGGPSDWPQALKQLRALAKKDQKAKRQLWLIDKMDLRADGDPVSVPAGEPLSASPRIVLFKALLTAPECNYLVEAATPMMQPSVIVDHSGRQVPNPVRTSDTASFPWPLENPAVHALNMRFAAISGTDANQGEPLQVLRYRPGQEYKPHLDAVPGLQNQRRLTVLSYLSDDYDGGETAFGKLGIVVKAGKGDVLLFQNCDDGGEPIDETIHAGLPVTRGVKFLGSRWIRERRLEA